MIVSREDRLTWARTIWGEARGEPILGQLAVAFVPYNRARISGRTVAQECLRPWQFSCWNKDDPNRVKMLAMTERDLWLYLGLVDSVLIEVADPSLGATFYHVRGLYPKWRLGHAPCVIVGHHVFFRNIAPYREDV